MKNKIRIISFLLVIIAVSCKTKKPLQELRIDEYETPPGTVKLSANLFIDQSEITNLSYLEFIWWTKKVYGDTAKEHIQILPMGSWYDLYKHYFRLDLYYLKHSVYRDYPVVGISYSQAQKFCKWRSDRVMEFILIREGIIKYDHKPHGDSAFSIEKYFSGNYNNVKPNSYLKHYPSYSLPDSITYIKALKFADSLNAKNYKYCGKKYCAKDILKRRCFENLEFKSDTLPYGVDPTVPSYCYKCRRPLLTHLLGNVSEITSKEGLCFGGSFKDSCNTKLFYRSKLPNAYSGFRNVCSWKKWE